MRHHYSQLNNQRGVATLLAVIIASFLVSLIVTAMVAMMVGELRQAIDAENGMKAYYQAEGESEDALLKIKDKVNDPNFSLASLNQSCDHFYISPTNVPAAPGDDGITCLAIRTLSDGSQRYTLAPDQPTQLNLTGQDINQVVVSWDSDPVRSGDRTFTPGRVAGSVGAWQATGSPAPIEVTLNSFPTAAPFAVSAIDTVTAYLVPCLTGSTVPGYGLCPAVNVPQNIRAVSGTGVVIPVSCDQPNGQLHCRVTLTGLSQRGATAVDSVLRLRPRFVGATYTLRAIDNAGNVKGLPMQYAQVDVTSKIGDSYRRVIHQVQVRSGAVGGDVLFGDADVCKRFELFEALNYSTVYPQAPCIL